MMKYDEIKKNVFSNLNLNELHLLKIHININIKKKNNIYDKYISKHLLNYLKLRKDKHPFIDKCKIRISPSAKFPIYEMYLKGHFIRIECNSFEWGIFGSVSYTRKGKNNYCQQLSSTKNNAIFDFIDYTEKLDLRTNFTLKLYDLFSDTFVIENIELLLLARKFSNTILSKLNNDEFRLVINAIWKSYFDDINLMK